MFLICCGPVHYILYMSCDNDWFLVLWNFPWTKHSFMTYSTTLKISILPLFWLVNIWMCQNGDKPRSSDHIVMLLCKLCWEKVFKSPLTSLSCIGEHQLTQTCSGLEFNSSLGVSLINWYLPKLLTSSKRCKYP